MMKIKDLIERWQAFPQELTDGESYKINISRSEVAKIEAIKELYSGLTTQMVVHQLLVSALNSFEEALPYVKGTRIIGEDEFGDPIFEDIGDTPKYIKLRDKHYHQLSSGQSIQ